MPFFDKDIKMVTHSELSSNGYHSPSRNDRLEDLKQLLISLEINNIESSIRYLFFILFFLLRKTVRVSVCSLQRTASKTPIQLLRGSGIRGIVSLLHSDPVHGQKLFPNHRERFQGKVPLVDINSLTGMPACWSGLRSLPKARASDSTDIVPVISFSARYHE